MANIIVRQSNLIFEHGKDLLVSSMDIADQLEARHSDFVRVIDRYAEKKTSAAQRRSFKVGSQSFVQDMGKDSYGREVRCWFLNEPAFMKTMTLTQRYEKADQIVDFIIEQFQIMRMLIQQRANADWIAARTQGKVFRKEETDTIKRFVEYAKAQGSQSAEKYYINFSRMENNALFFIEGKYPNIRDILSLSQLMTLQVADRVIRVAIEKGMNEQIPYKQIYQNCKASLESWVALTGGREAVPALKEHIVPTPLLLSEAA